MPMDSLHLDMRHLNPLADVLNTIRADSSPASL